MNAPFLNGPASPRDPFQGARTTTATSVLALARQWDDLTRQIVDDASYRQAELAAPPLGGDVWFNRLWDEREVIEAQITASAEPTVEAIAVKLRMMAWHMRYENGGYDGTRPLTDDENTIISALAAAESIIRRAHA
jgi:hypothetical protein